MKIKMVGTGSSTPSLRRLSPSCLVYTKAGTVLIDIGPSVVRRLLEFGCTVDNVDIIVITHFHPDHTVDLATFLFACNYGETERQKPLLIIGGKGIGTFYRRLLRLFPWIEPLNYRVTVKALPKGRWGAEGTTITTGPTNHRGESIAVRLDEDGKSAVFSGDTDYSPSLIELASGTDLFVVECSYPVRKQEGHLNLPTLQKIVKGAHPRQVIMTHLSTDWEEFNGSLPAPLLVGEDGMEIEL
jgi:ribonuclease BN (tRNA processing enzyme)